MLRATAVGLALFLTACRLAPEPWNELPEDVQAISFLGEPLRAGVPTVKATDDREARYRSLSERLAEDGADPDVLIDCGRRIAGLGRFKEAAAIFADGVRRFPDDARMYRHLGHRLITLRCPDRAIGILERAAELVRGRPDEPEPPLEPNARGVTIDSLQQNVFYHLGLARYLIGDFDGAAAAFAECRERSKNPDALCSATHWLYMSLRRAGRDDEAREALAPIRPDLDVVEYRAYFQLCLLYTGARDADALLAEAEAGDSKGTDWPTIGYGIANWHLYNGRVDRALDLFRRLAAAEQWAAFGCIASEAEWSRTALAAPVRNAR